MRPALVILTKIFPAIKNPPLPGKSARPAGSGRADDIRPYNAPLKNGAPESSRPTHVYFVCFACGETQFSVSLRLTAPFQRSLARTAGDERF